MQRVGEWIPFGGKKFLRNLTVYEDLIHDFDFTEVRFASVSPFGGPIAFVLNHSETTVHVVNAACRPLFTAELPSDSGEIVAIGWSHEEALVVVTNKPGCFLWVSNRKSFASVKLPRGHLLSSGLQSAVIRSVCAMLFSQGAITTIQFREKKEPLPLEFELPLTSVACADVLPASLNEADADVVFIGGTATVTVGRARQSVYTMVALPIGGEPRDANCAFPCPIAHIAVAPNGAFVAVALVNGQVRVSPTDLSCITKLIDLGVNKAPLAIHWCGSVFLHLQFNSGQFSDDEFDVGHFSLFLHATEAATGHKEVVKWDLEGSGIVFATTEIDGLRLLSDRANYFFEIVPQCLVDIFSHASKAKSAALCEAATKAAAGTIEGITALRALSENAAELYSVLDSIVAAAAAEFSQDAQERLLSVVAVATSQGWIKYDSDAYVDVCRRLRFFNNIRDERHCAIPISHTQYLALSGATELRQLQPREAQVVVDRLVQRGDFQWAVNVANFLGMKIDKVLVQWSVFRVMSATEEQKAHAEIVAALRQCPGAGFTEAALEAAALGKQRLAVQLLDSEPRSQSQVLLLLQMGLDEIAMEKAVASNDADLTYLVLLKLKHHMKPAAFYAALNRFEGARMQFLAAAQHSARLAATATQYLTEAGSERHVASIELANAFQPPTPNDEEVDDEVTTRTIAGTQRVSVDLMNRLEVHYAASDATRDEARLCTLHRELLKEQDSIIADKGDTEIYNLSLVDTIKYCVRIGLDEKAELLRKKFDVPEKKFWYAKLIALADSQQWDAIERMGGAGKNKPVKSPIGFLPFVEVLHERDQKEKAVLFVPKLATVIQRIDWFVKLDEFQLAVDEAFEEESEDLLMQIRKRAHNPSILQYIDERLKTLR